MKEKKKHSKKAVTLLEQIETLLSDVLKECAVIEESIEKNVRELLLSAEQSILKAKTFITPAPTETARRKAAKARKPGRPAAAKSRARASASKKRLTARAA